jgi:hypothetical protein|tara:strand:+ start:330 stop:626 length:297 start_codon:yes stop_codon:yes gene_type:complete
MSRKGYYASYDHFMSKSAGSHAVLRADVNTLLNEVDALSWTEQQEAFNGKVSDDFQEILELLFQHTRLMHITVMEANVRLLIIDPITQGATKPQISNK